MLIHVNSIYFNQFFVAHLDMCRYSSWCGQGCPAWGSMPSIGMSPHFISRPSKMRWALRFVSPQPGPRRYRRWSNAVRFGPRNMRFASPPRNSDGGNVPTFHAKWTWTVKTTGASGERLAKLWRSSCGANDHWEMDKIQILENCSFCCQHKVMGTLDARPCLGHWNFVRLYSPHESFGGQLGLTICSWNATFVIICSPRNGTWSCHIDNLCLLIGKASRQARPDHFTTRQNMTKWIQNRKALQGKLGIEYTVHNFKPFDSVYYIQMRGLNFHRLEHMVREWAV